MDALSSLMEGFTHALTPMNLLWVLVGCFLGTAVGVLRVSARRWLWRCSCR